MVIESASGFRAHPQLVQLGLDGTFMPVGRCVSCRLGALVVLDRYGAVALSNDRPVVAMAIAEFGRHLLVGFLRPRLRPSRQMSRIS